MRRGAGGGSVRWGANSKACDAMRCVGMRPDTAGYGGIRRDTAGYGGIQGGRRRGHGAGAGLLELSRGGGGDSGKRRRQVGDTEAARLGCARAVGCELERGSGGIPCTGGDNM